MNAAALALEDGSVYIGEPFGASTSIAAEIVFNTGITGYQEVATDPSYRGQMVVMTHPQIGNYGVADSGDESVRPWIAALIVRELAQQPHHWESRMRLQDFLRQWDVPGLQGIDTRALTRTLRSGGVMRPIRAPEREHQKAYTAHEAAAHVRTLASAMPDAGCHRNVSASCRQPRASSGRVCPSGAGRP